MTHLALMVCNVHGRLVTRGDELRLANHVNLQPKKKLEHLGENVEQGRRWPILREARGDEECGAKEERDEDDVEKRCV